MSLLAGNSKWKGTTLCVCVCVTMMLAGTKKWEAESVTQQYVQLMASENEHQE